MFKFGLKSRISFLEMELQLAKDDAYRALYEIGRIGRELGAKNRELGAKNEEQMQEIDKLKRRMRKLEKKLKKGNILKEVK